MSDQGSAPGLLWHALRRHWRWVLAATAGLGLTLTYVLDQQSAYTARITKAYLVASLPSQPGVDGVVIAANTDRAARNYARVVRDDAALLDQLGDRLGRTPDALRDRMETGYAGQGSSIYVRYTGDSAAEVQTFFNELDRIILADGVPVSNLPAGLVRPLQTDNSVVERAYYLGLHPAVGLLGGLVIGLLIAVALERSRPRVVNRAQLQSLTDLPVLEASTDESYETLAIRAFLSRPRRVVVATPEGDDDLARDVAARLRAAVDSAVWRGAIGPAATATPVEPMTSHDDDLLGRAASRRTTWLLVASRGSSLRSVEELVDRVIGVHDAIVVVADATPAAPAQPELAGATA
jgi:hypothetical protein